MRARLDLSKLIREKEGIKGGPAGFKKIAEIINKVIKDANGSSWSELKEKGHSYDDVMTKALNHYKKNN